MLDQRQSIRRRALLSGRIRIARLPLWATECSVCNVSDGGVSVTIPMDTMVPDTFEFDMSGQTPRKARLVWMRDGRAGLALIER